ncbi:MAG: hypothetical protein JJU00_06625 [Opitutales bacterium]|nr:hypothetical protein [Opitutales bacterium]
MLCATGRTPRAPCPSADSPGARKSSPTNNRVVRRGGGDLGVPWVGQYTALRTLPFWLDGFAPRPSDETADWVLENAVARPWARDAVDRRLVEEARTGGGRIIDSEQQVGGYPQHRQAL